MTQRQIIVSVTFRDFTGDANSEIQLKFLDALKKQTYQNFKVVVTNFREKHVLKTMQDSGLDFELVQSPHDDCWHSWSEVVANGFSFMEKGKHIYLWTNADNIFEPTFFEKVVKNFKPGFGGTSIPHITYANLDDYLNDKPFEKIKKKPIRSFYELDPTLYVPDVVFLDGDLLLDPELKKLYDENRFKGAWPGMAQSLMLAFCSNNLINLIYDSPIANIDNVRFFQKKEPTPQEQAEIERKQQIRHDETQSNIAKMIRFCQARNIPKIYWKYPFFRRIFQHFRYKPVGSFSQKLKYYTFYFKFVLLRIFRRLLK